MDLSKVNTSKNVEMETPYGEAMAQAMMEFLNKKRAEHGKPPLDPTKLTRPPPSLENNPKVKAEAEKIANSKVKEAPGKGGLYLKSDETDNFLGM